MIDGFNDANIVGVHEKIKVIAIKKGMEINKEYIIPMNNIIDRYIKNLNQDNKRGNRES